MTKASLLIFQMFFLPVLLSAKPQDYVAGRVLDEDGHELQGVTVEVIAKDSVVQVIKTGPTGQFALRHLPKTSFYLRFSDDYHLGEEIRGHLPSNLIIHLRKSMQAESTSVNTMAFDIEPTSIDSMTENVKVEAAWNRWIDNDDLTAVNTMQVGSYYTIHFDLAGIDYSRLANSSNTVSAVPDESLSSLLKDPKARQRMVVVKPFVETSAASISFGREGALPYMIDLDKIRKTAENLKQIDDRQDLRAISAVLAAVQIPIIVHAETPGCAQIGLAIWDGALRHPLDILRTAVDVTTGNSTSAFACGTDSSIKPLSSGIVQTLLSTSNVPKADAGLFFFEFATTTGEIVNTAMFIGPDYQVLSWQPTQALTSLLFSDDASSVGRQIQAARCKRLDSCVENFGPIAKMFSDVLFSDKNIDGEKAATAARKALEQLTARVGNAPTILMRFTDREGNTRPLPFGLLKLGPKLLGDASTILQPLPIPRYDADSVCISNWKNFIPSSLGGDDIVPDNYLQIKDSPTFPVLRKWSQLRDYLNETNHPTSQGEGLLLVAHHGAGFIRFEPTSSDFFYANDIKHDYAPGSVAVIGACSTAALTPLNKDLPFVTALNKHGIDAMIVAPFEVSAPLASRFAIHFFESVAAAREKHETPNLSELFEMARLATRRELSMAPFLDELAEFSLLGNANIKLCQ